MRLYTITLLDIFNGNFIESIPFQSAWVLDMDAVDYEGILFSLGLNYDLNSVEMFVTDNGPISMVPVVEF